MKTPHNQEDLARLVEHTVAALNRLTFPLDLPGTAQLDENRKSLATQLATRVRPHLTAGALPTVVVFGGSSGAGKSTIFNSLLGEDASPASVLRPTTRTPVIAMHPADAAAMEGHAVTNMGKLILTEGAIPGLVLVDAPDLDSIDSSNRELARRLLDAADLWLFVTTASRYGDATAWNMLLEAHERGLTTAVILNRIRPEAVYDIRADLTERLRQRGMEEDAFLVIPDAGPRDARLDPSTVAELHDWLRVIGSTTVGRALAEQASIDMLPTLRVRLLELAEAAQMQANTIQDLADRAREASVASSHKLEVNAKNGRFGQGAPTTSWLTLASSGNPLAGLAAGEKPRFFGRAKEPRDAAAESVFSGVVGAIRLGVVQGVVTAQGAIEDSWRELPVDLSDKIEAARRGVDAHAAAEASIAAWTQDLAQLVGARSNPWLGAGGLVALLGAAAGGVAGAAKALRHVGLDGSLRDAREALATRVGEAISGVAESYAGVMESIDVSNGRELRVRASEFLDRV